MAAPLYSRYKRNIDRESKRFRKNAPGYHAFIKSWKSPKTAVYSLSDNASSEVGAYSALPPNELIKALEHFHLPAECVWVEMDFLSMLEGAIQKDRTDSYFTSNYRTAPIRLGLLLKRMDAESRTIIALPFYLRDTGSCGLGSGMLSISKDGKSDRGRRSTTGYYQHFYGVGTNSSPLGQTYTSKYRKEHPEDTKRLCDCMGVLLPSEYASDPEAHEKYLRELDGSVRLVYSTIAAIMTARSATYTPDPNSTPRDKRRGSSAPPRTVVEVDLFLKNFKRPGTSIKHSVSSIARKKSGLHSVGGNFAYRRRPDGQDPRECRNGWQHDFEKIEGTSSEVCVFCSQRRWWRAEHERGDEAYGVISQKVRNVRR